jgi:hypothetical protein
VTVASDSEHTYHVAVSAVLDRQLPALALANFARLLVSSQQV